MLNSVFIFKMFNFYFLEKKRILKILDFNIYINIMNITGLFLICECLILLICIFCCLAMPLTFNQYHENDEVSFYFVNV